jgi:UDP-glucuronate decarboxylase
MTLDRAEEIIRARFGLHVVRQGPAIGRGGSLYVHSQLLVDLWRHLELYDGTPEKAIPAWVLGLPLSRLKWFIEGYRVGDGVHGGKKLADGVRHEFSTVSTRLKNDLVVALGRFGLVPSVGRYETTFRQRTGDRRYPFWRLTLCNVAPWSPLSWDMGVEQRLAAERYGDLVWAEVMVIEEVPASPLVYDFCVPGSENFWAGTGVLAHNTYGPRMRPDDGRAIPTFISQALRGEPITVHGTGAQTRSITYVDDLVRGIVALLDSTETGPINCGTEHELTMRELAERIVRLTGSRSEITFLPRTADDPEKRRPDLTLARQKLGYEPQVGPDEGLLPTIEYFRSRLS